MMHDLEFLGATRSRLESTTTCTNILAYGSTQLLASTPQSETAQGDGAGRLSRRTDAPATVIWLVQAYP